MSTLNVCQRDIRRGYVRTTFHRMEGWKDGRRYLGERFDVGPHTLRYNIHPPRTLCGIYHAPCSSGGERLRRAELWLLHLHHLSWPEMPFGETRREANNIKQISITIQSVGGTHPVSMSTTRHPLRWHQLICYCCQCCQCTLILSYLGMASCASMSHTRPQL